MTQTKKTIKSLSEFPNFDKMSYEEEAEWWETHDLSQVWDKMDDIEIKFVPAAARVPNHLKRLTSAINVRLDPVDHRALRAVANKKGLGIVTF